MNFFVPKAKDEKEAEEVYNDIKQFVSKSMQWKITNRRIFKIKYYHDGKDHYAEVGKASTVNGETVLAILESNAFLVCTPSRGAFKGQPIMVGGSEIVSIIDFE